MSKKNNFVFAMLLFPFILPLSISGVDSLHKITIVLKMASFGIIVLYYLFNLIKKRITLNKVCVIIIAYILILLLSTILNHASIGRCLSYGIPIISVFLILNCWFEFDSKAPLKFIKYLLSIYVIINLFTIFKNREMYFLGEDNRFIFTMLVLITSCIIFDINNFGYINKKSIYIYLLCLITLLIRWSVGAFIGVLLIGILYLINNKKEKFNVKYFYIIIGIIYLFCFIPQLQNILLDIFQTVFNKRQTVESRFMLWERALDYLKNNPLLGYGIENIDILESKFIVVHCHNMFLQIAYECGIIGLLIYIFFLHTVKKYNDKCENNILKNSLNIIFVVIFVMGIFDTYNHCLIFLVFYLIYFSNYKIKNKDKIENNN